MADKPAKAGRPTGSVKSPYDTQILFKVTKEQREDIQRAARKIGVSTVQFCRDAVVYRLGLIPSGKDLFDRQMDIPVFVEKKASKRRTPKGPITIVGIQAHDKYKTLWPFIERFLWVSERHRRLGRSVLKTKESKIPYFDTHDLDNMIREMQEQTWDSKKVLDALDALDHYNGDSDHDWGVADFTWLFHKPQRSPAGWAKLLKRWELRPGATDEPRVIEVTMDQCKPMAKWISEAMSFIEGSSEANAVLDFCFEKCNAYGYEKVRTLVKKFVKGPDGWKNFRAAFNDPKNLE